MLQKFNISDNIIFISKSAIVIEKITFMRIYIYIYIRIKNYKRLKNMKQRLLNY